MGEESLSMRIAGFAVILILGWLAVSTRLYVRFVIVKKLSLDDWLIFVTLLCFTVVSVMGIVMTKMGLGLKDKYITQHDISEILKLFYFNECIYIVATVILKLSIAGLLLLFAYKQAYRLIILFTSAFYALCGLVFLFVIIFQCEPIAHGWDPSIDGSCIQRPTFVALILCNAVISLVTDAIFATIPIVLIWNIQMDKKTKFVTGFVLGLGLTTSIVNIARLFFIQALGSVENRPYRYYTICFLSVLEVGIGTIAASLATIRPLFQRILGYFGNLKTLVFSQEQKGSRSDPGSNINTPGSKLGGSLHIPNAMRRQGDEEAIIARHVEKNDIESWVEFRSDSHIKAVSISKGENHTSGAGDCATD